MRADLNQARFFQYIHHFLGKKKQKGIRPGIRGNETGQCIYMYFASVFRYCEWVSIRLKRRQCMCLELPIDFIYDKCVYSTFTLHHIFYLSENLP